MAGNSLTTVNFLASVQAPLQQVEALMRAQADQHHPDLQAALQHLLSSGGKRVRPAIALMVGHMLGGETERLVTLGAAIELLHTATLVHDDLIDGAFLRRGIATLNAQWSPAATVLTGDFIFARAARLAAATNSVPMQKLFAETLATIVNGEITQLFSAHGLASRENYDQRIYAKTASLFELSTGAAAMLSPVDDEVVATMQRFGYFIGMAFQIVDDVLDFTADQAALGKPVAGDLRQGLITLPALYYLESAPDDPTMQAIMAGKSPAEPDMARLIVAIRSSGGIEKALAEARSLAEQGVALLSAFPQSPERTGLEDMARYFVNRKV